MKRREFTGLVGHAAAWQVVARAQQQSAIGYLSARTPRLGRKGGSDVKRIGYFVAAASLLLSLPSVAHTPQQAPHQSFSEGDLKLESGEVIKDFSISYVTHGTLNVAKSNAILMVTAISGNHHQSIS